MSKADIIFMDNCKKIIKTREWVKDELVKLGFTALDSKTNFLFVKHDRVSGEEIYLKLKEKGVLVRHFNKERIKEFNRVTIGSDEQMQTFLKAIKEILEDK